VIDLEANPREERAAAVTLPADAEAKMLVFAQRHFSPAYQDKFQRNNVPHSPLMGDAGDESPSAKPPAP
jgi:hypothetical protein